MTKQKPICVDDFGTEVYLCRYTCVPVWADKAKIIGATIPGVKAVYLMADTQDAKLAHKKSGIAFHESEANCNTCIYLCRVKSNKCKSGFLYGTCGNPESQKHQNPYYKGSDVFAFHPDDPMHMPCYLSRFQ